MYGKLKISHHKHSGHLRPHEHTSYLPLAILVVMVGFVLIGSTVSTFASSGPGSGSIGLTGTVPTTPPKTASTIDSPGTQQHFSTSPITITGTCPSNTLVEIFKNNIFAGSTPCEANGTYSIQIDLLYGENIITSQVYDVLNQAGPVSSPITVFYDAIQPLIANSSLLNFTETQLVLNTNSVYRGTFPGQPLSVPITILGGVSPFAVNVEWGDSGNQVIARSNNSIFNATHMYEKPGTYKITIQATDSEEQVAFLTVAAIVNGQPSVVASSSTTPKASVNKFLVIWPLYAIAATLVFGFWFGERREKRLLGYVNPVQTQPLGTTPRSS